MNRLASVWSPGFRRSEITSPCRLKLGLRATSEVHRRNSWSTLGPHRYRGCIRWLTIWLGIGLTTSWGQGPQIQRVSVPDPTVVGGPRATGNGDSEAPRYSRDGKFLVFTSAASDLVTNDVTGFRRDVFVRELATGRTALVSVTPEGDSGNDDSWAPDLSADGRYVAFTSRASDLVANDTNQVADVFVRDLVQSRTVRISITPDGIGGDLESSAPRLAANGQVVAFASRASNLVAGVPDPDNRVDLFVRNLSTGVTALASGEAREGTDFDVDEFDLSDDGRWLAFLTISTNVVAAAPSRTPSGAFVRDLAQGTTARIELTAGTPSSARSTVEARSLAFAPGRARLAVATWITTPPQSASSVVEVTDLTEAGPVFLGGAAGSSGTLLDEPTPLSFDPSGTTLAFAQTVQPGLPAVLRLWQETTGVTTLTNAATGRPMRAQEVALGPEGRILAFTSLGTDAVPGGGEPTNLFQLYVLETALGATSLLSTNAVGAPTGGLEYARPTFSAAGTLAFQTRSDEWIAADQNQASDILQWDSATRRVEVLSSPWPTKASAPLGQGSLIAGGISADGSRILFASNADDLVPDDAKGQPDLFVRDLAKGRTLLVTVPGATNGPSRPGFGEATLSANGRFVAFTADLVVTRPDGVKALTPQVFVRDLASARTRTVGLNAEGQPVTLRSATQPRISADGRYVAFFAEGAAFVDGASTRGGLVLRDLVLERNWLVDTTVGLPAAISLAGLGGRVLPTWTRTTSYRSVLFDPVLGTHEEFINPAGTTTLLSYDGRRVVFSLPGLAGEGGHRLRWRDQGSTEFHELELPAADGIIYEVAGGTPDGHRLALAERETRPGGARRTLWAVDLEARSLARIDALPDGVSGSVPGVSFGGFSPDGRLAAFQSASDALVAEDTDGEADIFVRDLVAAETTRLSRKLADPWRPEPTRRPLLSADGRRLAFASWSAGFTTNDDNGAEDVFAVELPPGPNQDADGDGLSDDWELTWFGNLARDGSGDYDADGIADAAEFRAGANPLDPAIGVRVELHELGPGIVELRWPTELGHQYRVEIRDSVVGSDWVPLGEAKPGDGQTARTRIEATAVAQFFRLRVESGPGATP